MYMKNNQYSNITHQSPSFQQINFSDKQSSPQNHISISSNQNIFSKNTISYTQSILKSNHVSLKINMCLKLQYFILISLIFFTSGQKFSFKTTLMNYSNVAFSVISQDNTILVTGSLDTYIYIYVLNYTSQQYLINQTIAADNFGVKSVDISMDNSLIVSGGLDNTIKIWKYNLLTLRYQLYQLISAHTNTINCVRFNLDSTMIISGSNDHTVIIWQWNNTILKYINFQILSNNVNSVIFCDISNDNSIIAALDSNRTIVWSLQNNGLYIMKNTIIHNVSGNPTSLRLVDKNDRLLIGIYNTILIYRLDLIMSSYNLVQWINLSPSGYAYFDVLKSGQFIYIGHSNYNLIFIYKFSINMKAYEFYEILIPNISSKQIIVNKQNSKLINVGFNYNYSLYQISLNCTSDTNSIGIINQYINACYCMQMYKWNQIEHICYLNCSLDPKSNKKQTQTNECQCNVKYYWSISDHQCQYNCSLDPYSNGTNKNSTSCYCITNYDWSIGFNSCTYNCSLDINSNGVNINAISCQCNVKYYWSISDHQCQYNCSLDPYSNGTNKNSTSCHCITNYDWSIGFNSCTYNCSLDFNSNGINLDSIICQCQPNYFWGPLFYNKTQSSCIYYSSTINSFTLSIFPLISTPDISLLFQCLQPFLSLIDDFYYYLYHKRNYDTGLLYFISIMFNITQSRWIPTYIKQYVITYKTLVSQPLNSLKDMQFRTPPHFSKLGEDVFFLKNTLDYFTLNIPLSILLFAVIKLIYLRIRQYKFISQRLLSFSSYCFLFTNLIGDNVTYISFRSFSQLYLLNPVNFLSYINLIICYLSLFIVIIYSIGGFFLFRYFFKKKLFKELLEIYKPNIKSTILMSIQLSLNVLCGFTHAALYNHPFTQIKILLSIQIIRMGVLLIFYSEFRSKFVNILMIYENMFRIILHIFLMIELWLLQTGMVLAQYMVGLGNSQINVIIIIICLNVMQVTILLFVGLRDKIQSNIQKDREQILQKKKNNRISKNKVKLIKKQRNRYSIRPLKIPIQIYFNRNKIQIKHFSESQN